ncbi:hypothetical protein BJ138DRAFT_1181626 [Hygrophoropsis aurantiaca]|uniref:Uncharacterized protein n=1 Tax=Hygrophoropsis aurantiaca TaxID=72124 RepID=A0ACB8A7F8_9AGAM|nr:hypothetical protein BJ138DRAFT_1181626 [Hygrophoropsis aurantiaca]
MERTTHHTIFSLQEILLIIFRFCTCADRRDGEKQVTDKGTLVSLARTCWSFHAPALDVLYSDTNMVRLVQTMSRNLWYIDLRELCFQRPMDLQDWNIFLHYARRVRILRTFGGFEMSATIFQTLSHPPNNFSNIFPRLVDLRVGNPVHHEFISLLLTRNLTTILLPFIEGDEIATNILPTLPSVCPYLRHIELSRSEYQLIRGTINSPGAYEVLYKLPLLETLLCPDVVMSRKILSHVACLPSLKVIDINLPMDPLEEFGSNRNTFPVLQRLEISSPTPQSCLQFLESVTSSSMDAIHLRTFGMFSEEASYDILVALSSFTSLTHITILECHAEKDGIYRGGLDPLLHLHNLQQVWVCSDSTYSVDDQMLSQMASAWPRIEYLYLWPPDGWETDPITTLPGIIPLLQRCPNLHFLGTTFDATLPIHADLFTYDICSSKTPLDLNVGHSPIVDPPAIAAFLSHMAPNLRALAAQDMSCEDETCEAHKAKWGQVGQIIGIESEHWRVNTFMFDCIRGSLSSLNDDGYS